MSERRYHPWRILRGLPHVRIAWSPAVTRGRIDGHTITLHPLLTQAERRTTLAHELVHLFDDDLDSVADALGDLRSAECGQNVGTRADTATG